MRKLFALMNEDTSQVYGFMTFNGHFTFQLSNSIDLATWNRIGFIPLDDSRYIESVDLFRHLNSRLPIGLRKESNEKKLHYIESNGLRVASDHFFLKRINAQAELLDTES